jgi:voltage-gated potassium channel
VRRLLISSGLFAAVILVGVAGYVAIEHWSWFDALYMTVTTITTIGGGEPEPLSNAGKWWTLGVIVFGVGVTTYVFFTLAGYLLEGRFLAAVGERRLRGRVRALSEHYILCGFGRVGREIAHEIVAAKHAIVVIDVNDASLDEAARQNYPIVRGNAADIEVLRQAGIERARGLAVATDSDADNVYVTLSARVLRPDLFIIARANADDSEAKLRLAGASRVISPYHIGGKRMANLALRPTVVDFIETVLQAGNADLLLEEFTIPATSACIGKTLRQFVAPAADATVLAIKRADHMTFRPPEDTLLQAGDDIVAAGPSEAIAKLEQQLR